MKRIAKYLKIPEMKEHHLKKHIDSKLYKRLWMFLAIVMILAGLMLYDVLQGILSVYLAFGGFILGILIGFFVSRMFLIHWHEESAKVVSRIDAFGVVILVGYLIFALSRTWIFAHWIHGATLTAFTFSIMGGIMLGRLLGMRLNIRQVLLSRGISLEDGTKH